MRPRLRPWRKRSIIFCRIRSLLRTTSISIIPSSATSWTSADINCKAKALHRAAQPQGIPGLSSYSLGNLCRQLKINIQNRHRATGDALATVQLFEMLMASDTQGAIEQALNGRSKDNGCLSTCRRNMWRNCRQHPACIIFIMKKGKWYTWAKRATSANALPATLRATTQAASGRSLSGTFTASPTKRPARN